MNAAFRVLALLGRLVSAVLDGIRRRKAQERFDRVERDPAAEFLRRFKRGEGSGSDSGSGKRDEE
jgi:hypothetical protein